MISRTAVLTHQKEANGILDIHLSLRDAELGVGLEFWQRISTKFYRSAFAWAVLWIRPISSAAQPLLRLKMLAPPPRCPACADSTSEPNRAEPGKRDGVSPRPAAPRWGSSLEQRSRFGFGPRRTERRRGRRKRARWAYYRRPRQKWCLHSIWSLNYYISSIYLN